MNRQYDAIIVGGGHNGLTCGAYLSKAGKKVLVLERKPWVGGASVTEEFVPGFRASVYSFIMGHLHPKVIAELELYKYGLEHVVVDNVVNPTETDCVVFTKDPVKTRQQIARFSQKDAENYPKFYESLSSTIRILQRLQLETPINPFRKDLMGLLKTARFAWRYRHAEQEVYNLVSALSMSAHDYVSRWFESDIIKAKFMFWATIGGNVGPYSPGTAFYLVTHLIGQTGMSFPKGGMGSIADAIAASGQAKGMEIRTEAEVDEILVNPQGRAGGVRLNGGEEIRARRVVSNVNARLTFGHLVRRGHLPEDFMERIDGYRARGKSFKLLCAVDRLPQYSGFSREAASIDYPAYAHICPTPEFLERAFDEAKYGWYSSNPFLSPSVPTYYDPDLAPEGKHIVTFQGGVSPYSLENSTWEKERGQLVKNAFSVMNRFAPGFTRSVIDYKLYLPEDIEADINMPGGNTEHGELTLDQLFFMRPVPGYADYRSPIRGLYQCGASTHPGGAVSAVNGHNAAREILRDRRWN
ncbi:MAG: NAD(P)/FAD-dependent oxidoreductase [Hyphomonadaceae bacterium]|nr:NAD(P)/FAD-dependent oxidoreductase [Hyphomonadaceae bacterium]